MKTIVILRMIRHDVGEGHEITFSFGAALIFGEAL